MKDQKPETGGVSTFLEMVAVLSVFAVFFAGALANLSASAELLFVSGAIISAAILWALAAIVRALRGIEFNTRTSSPIAITEPSVVLNPVARDASDAMAVYGIERDGDKYRFGEYLYSNLQDAVNYARRSKA